ncbi:hypothetical protein SteCoe_24224 [Stentor coeruleus]|uniref:Uncharacterized protein n=1 Tax=Stentor coeruleus TaxID=5963 RepID=A0A1R2BI45_9CILI|nr:hypothetical protein SteCoe_24224 [Stentor coeruleus]
MFRVLIRVMSDLTKTATGLTLVKRVEQISSMDIFTLGECKNEILSLKNSVDPVFLSGIKVSQEELDMLEKVAFCFKDSELYESYVSIATRKDICQILNCDPWEVTKFVILYKSFKRVHEYLIARIKRGETLPKTQEEIKAMLLSDPEPKTKMTRFLQYKPRKYSKKQQKYDYRKSDKFKYKK